MSVRHSRDIFLRARAFAAGEPHIERGRGLAQYKGGGGAYLGQVATRSALPNTKNASYTQIFSRTIHIMRDAPSWIKLEFPNWYLGGSGETAMGGDATIYAGLEYPLGSTPVRIPFGGLAAGTIPDGQSLLSDALAISIPAGEQFAIKTLYENSAGVPYITVNRNQAAERWQGGTGALTDNTTTSTNPSTLSTLAYVPAAIIGMTRRRTFFFAGDSKVQGQGDTSGIGLKGELERSIGGDYAFINACRGGEGIVGPVTDDYSRRLALSGYCSDVISNYGINDISAGSSAELTASRLAEFAEFFTGKPVHQMTVAPRSASSDGFATVENQTTHGNNAERVELNSLIRAGIAGFTGFIELADVVESARDSGLWKAGHTSDGLHENATGYQAVKDAEILPPSS